MSVKWENYRTAVSNGGLWHRAPVASGKWEARVASLNGIPEYYRPGDDKLIFRRALR